MPVTREGSRPRPAAAGLLTKPGTCGNRGTKYALRVVACPRGARGSDAAPVGENHPDAPGYVGQAACPPWLLLNSLDSLNSFR